jgi:hypothetical protein
MEGRRASAVQHPDHLEKDNMLKEDEHKHRQNVKKGKSIKK